jgi:hypothetical protein
MPEVKVVKTLEEIKDGRLLNLDDLNSLSWVSLPKILPTKFIVEVPGIYRTSYDGRDVSVPEYTVEKELTSLNGAISEDDRACVPIIKGCIAIDLSIAWYNAQILCDVAKSLNIHGENGWWQEYQRTVVLYARATEKYKDLVNSLLLHFEPSAREEIRIYLLCKILEQCASKACWDLEYGLTKDINEHSNNRQNLSQTHIEHWSFLFSLTAAVVAESIGYTKAYDECLYFKTGVNSNRKDKKQLHPSDPSYKNNQIEILQNKLSIAKKQLIKFIDFRKREGLPIENSSAGQTISHNIGVFTKHVMLLFSSCSSNPTADEEIPLIGLQNYIPIYAPPKRASINPIDKDIVQMEQELIGRHTSIRSDFDVMSDHQFIMNISRDFIKLLLLVHMRYRNSFDSKNTWSLFESPGFANKTQYFTILGKYMEPMSECLALIIQYVKNFITAQPRNIAEINHLLMEVREMLDSLQFYMNCTNTHDCQASDKPIRILNTLCSTLDETFDVATGLDEYNARDNLHKRHGISVV